MWNYEEESGLSLISVENIALFTWKTEEKQKQNVQ
jgi:hypothetical protein